MLDHLLRQDILPEDKCNPGTHDKESMDCRKTIQRSFPQPKRIGTHNKLFAFWSFPYSQEETVCHRGIVDGMIIFDIRVDPGSQHQGYRCRPTIPLLDSFPCPNDFMVGGVQYIFQAKQPKVIFVMKIMLLPEVPVVIFQRCIFVLVKVAA